MSNPPTYLNLTGSFEALLVALEERDAYTRHHCDRAVPLVMELGAACGLSDAELGNLSIAAHCHDIGKVGVPDAVLLKPGRLSSEEWDIIRAHPAQGERIFRATGLPIADVIAPLIRHHHESFDGSGYPDGLKKECIPLACRIMLIADGYDAMATARPYHKARSHAEVMEILGRENGKKLDPEVFQEFSRLIEQSPARAESSPQG